MKVKAFVSLLIVSILMFLFCSIAIANPIPVYPDPNPITSGPGAAGGFSYVFLILIFVMDFCLDLFIIYGALVMFDRASLLDMLERFGFRTSRVVKSTLIVSVVGVVTEVFFGTWIIGLLLVLVAVFISFTFVTYYLLRLDFYNSLRTGFVAVIINILFWLVIFSL